MVALLGRGVMLFLYNLILTAVGEAMIQWVFFKVAKWAVSKTKTTADDEYIERLEKEYLKKHGT